MSGRCPAIQTNRRVPDFDCKLGHGHGQAHIDQRSGTRWGEGQVPRGMRRHYMKKYANPKLHRHSQLGVSIARKNALAAPKKGK